MGYFVVKMVQLSGKKQVPLDTTTDHNDQKMILSQYIFSSPVLR